MVSQLGHCPSKKVTLKQSAGAVNSKSGGKTSEQQAAQLAAERTTLESDIQKTRHETMKKIIENIK